MKRVLVLGSGIIGITSAYILAKRGYEVVVIDRQSEAAAETSFANGGQLSYSHAEPWANPHVLPKVFKWLGRDDAPLVFRPSSDRHMISWGLQFLRNCTNARADRNSINTLRLNLYSQKKMQELCEETQIEFDLVKRGVLHIFGKQEDLDHAAEQSKFQEKYGCPMTVLDRQAALELEPALAHAGKPIIGAVHAPIDENGDANKFGQGLKDICEKMGVEFHFKTSVERMHIERGRITHIDTSAGKMKADHYVMSLGSYSPVHLRKIGVRVPIYPMKGYSLTYAANEFSPNVSITDQEEKIVYSRLGNRMRLAGTAEFAGYDTSVNPVRIKNLVRAVEKLFPKAAEAERLSEWACLRPSTPEGLPILGRCKVENLVLNTGHGTLGWTMAAGSAHLMADIFDGRPTEISLEGLTADRYCR